jgi:histidinol dehydrogenase
MKILDARKPKFWKELVRNPRSQGADSKVQSVTAGILAAVRKRGDAALVEFNNKFSRVNIPANKLRIGKAQIAAAKSVSPELKKAIEFARANIAEFARKSLRQGWSMKNRQGAWVGEKFDPFQRVGCYVPGGTAPLVSTSLMTITLAKVAGVKGIVAVTPPPVNPGLLYALDKAGATEIYQVGGAQAIAALAFGTKTIRPVNKIVGPGNAFVTEAKRQVFGFVSIDLLAGPSEVLIIADKSANAAFIAADMLAQAEHGPGYQVYLVTDSDKVLKATQAELRKQTETLARKGIITAAQAASMILIRAKNMAQAIDIVNELAVEHVEVILSTFKQADNLARKLTTSGALFLGPYTPTVVGDFVAGPSHVLPTGAAGKSFAGLTVNQFQRRTSVIAYEKKTLRKSLDALLTISKAEQLDAHARSADIRFFRQKSG